MNMEDYEYKKSGRGYKVKVTCQSCGEELWQPWNVVKDGRGKYCNSTCYNEHRHQTEELGNYEQRRSKSRHIEVKIICEWCGEDTWVKWVRRKQGLGRFCNKQCANASTNESRREIYGKENAHFRWDGDRNTWYAYWKDLDGTQRNTTKSRWLWDMDGREIPDGYWVTYIDEDRENCVLENLKVVPRGEIMSKALMGHKHSEETKRKLSAAHTGKIISDEQKENIRETMKNQWEDPNSVFNTDEYRERLRGHTPWNKDMEMSEEYKKKVSRGLLRYWSDPAKKKESSDRAKKRYEDNPELRKQVSDANKARFSDPKERHKISQALQGREITEEHREKLSKALTGNPKISRENSNFWRGGISDDPYPPEFTPHLKNKIKVRDNNICQACRNVVEGKSAHIHHIDRDKQNCAEWNLVLLCVTCHNAVHDKNNQTNDGIEYFRSRLE